jgi:hypothetical protein
VRKRVNARVRVRWIYCAKLNYLIEAGKGKWIIGFLNDEGNPYECPTTTDQRLVEKLEKLEKSDLAKELEVTVEGDDKMDKWGKRYPVLIDARARSKSL